jgi:signal transduction histidine kinase
MKEERDSSVLIVDDDPGVLDSTSLLLKEYGYHVFSAANAKDAINVLETNSIDVVLSDIVMPGISGIELLEKIHKTYPDIPVILMTAYADIEKAVDAVKMRAFDFIIKPYKYEVLINSIGKAIRYNNLIKTERDYKHLLEEFSQEIETLVAERTMSLMALTIADKIRNPASVIGLTCKRMLERADVPETLKGSFSDIIHEAEKLDTIVKEFQSYLKSKQSMFQYRDINEILRSIIPVLSKEAEPKGIEIIANLSVQPIKINIQRNLFQVAVSHVIKNAIESTPDGGRIRVSVIEENNNVILSVSDTGYGISKEDIDKIFTPAFSSKEQKFGMGLPLVKQIVSVHIGEINVESKLGEGTTFRIKLPLRWN